MLDESWKSMKWGASVVGSGPLRNPLLLFSYYINFPFSLSLGILGFSRGGDGRCRRNIELLRGELLFKHSAPDPHAGCERTWQRRQCSPSQNTPCSRIKTRHN